MNIKQLFLVGLVLLVFSACKKSNRILQPEPANQVSQKLKQTSTLNSNGHQTEQKYFYNDQGFLKKDISIDLSSGPAHTQEYYYQAHLPSYSVVWSGETLQSRLDFVHKDNKLAEISYSKIDELGAMEYTFTDHLEYSGGQLSKIYKSDKVITRTYTLIKSLKGNIVELKEYAASGMLMSVAELTHDNKPNPYKGNPGLMYQALGHDQNNQTGLKVTDYLEPGFSYQRTYQYEYNAQGLPVKQFQADQRGTKLVKTYSYIPDWIINNNDK